MSVTANRTAIPRFYTKERHPAPVRRLAVLHSKLSGYMVSCLKALKTRHNIQLLVFRWPVSSEAPFDSFDTLDWIDALYTKRNQHAEDILQIVKDFRPDGLLIPGWMDRDYLKVARVMKKQGVTVVAGSDTQWQGTLRQWGGKLLAPHMLHNAIDVLWVAGERQRTLARHLGFTGENCWSGLYACDWKKFAYVFNTRDFQSAPAFLYVGRYTYSKGLDVLLAAYRTYRASVSDPWPLICAGAGEQQHILSGQKGVIDKGFVQPDRLPTLLGKASVFVLPSRKEPWGVALQEAAASGLPLICSTACGASIGLLQDAYNGYLFENGDADHLSRQLIQMHNLQIPERLQMGERSHELSKQFTPQRWADTLVKGLKRRSVLSEPDRKRQVLA